MSCRRRPVPRITSINDESAPATHTQHSNAFAAIAEKVGRAVVVLAIFDEHGGLVANQHGVFISPEGDLVAERTAMNNAASATLKGADGHAYDTLGTYVRLSSPYFIRLKTTARNVPHLENYPAAGTVADGAPAAIIFSAADESRAPFLEGRITSHKNDETGEWLTFEPPPPKTALGAPVVDASGAIIGIVAQHSEKDAPAIAPYAGVTSAAMAEASPEEISETSIVSPAEGPEETSPATPAPMGDVSTPPPIANSYRSAEIDTSRLQSEPSTPFATPKGFFIRMNPNWHLHAKDRPPPPGGDVSAPQPNLLYTPAPRYPARTAEGSRAGGGGSYRVTFNEEGKVTDVEVTRSAGSNSLDAAAMATLRNWRSEPGREWSVVVPIRFK